INALDALDAGAVDFVKKPVIKTPKDRMDFVNELTLKIKIAATARIGRPQFTAPTPLTTPTLTTSSLSASSANNKVIAIGASTGGTEATLEVIKNLPANTPGIVITQHMPAGFTKMYAERLDRICKMRVKEAENMDRVVQGQIIIGAGGFQMQLMKDSKGFYIKSQPGEKVSGHCPSVDVLFDSVSKCADTNSIGVLLTGMGSDGANGLLAMRKKGAFTIGQDKETCVVYGMPMVAYNMGAVMKQLPLTAMPNEIINQINKMR
ncbi:MAG: chemotaxis protein CheB, partial [Oscillospiraceae bacterium]